VLLQNMNETINMLFLFRKIITRFDI